MGRPGTARKWARALGCQAIVVHLKDDDITEPLHPPIDRDAALLAIPVLREWLPYRSPPGRPPVPPRAPFSAAPCPTSPSPAPASPSSASRAAGSLSFDTQVRACPDPFLQLLPRWPHCDGLWR